MFQGKVYLDFHEAGVLSEVTGRADEPFDVFEEQVQSDGMITFRLDAREHRDDIYDALVDSGEVGEVRKLDDRHLLVEKEASGALPIIRQNHGKLHGIDRVYGTKRVFEVLVFRREDLREILLELKDLGRVKLGQLLPIGDPASRLTERQQAVMQRAFEEGYYTWPRTVDARDLAEDLDMAHSTLLEHLRKAEGKLIEVALTYETSSTTPQEREFLLGGA